MKRTVALAVVLLALVLPAWVPGAVAATDYLEDFDDDAVNSDPTGDFYAYTESGTGDMRVVSSQSDSAPNSFLFKDGGADASNAIATFDTSLDLCLAPAGARIEFDVRVSAFSTGDATEFIFGEVARPGDADSIQFTISSDGSVSIGIAGSTSTVSGVTFLVNTWYHVVLQQFNCVAPSSVTIFLPDFGADGTSLTRSDPDGLTDVDFFQICDGTQGFCNEGTMIAHTLYLDNLEYLGFQDPPPPSLGAAATWAVGQTIMGFDTNDGGDIAIIRHTSGGEIVETRGTTSFTDANQEDDTDCNSAGNDDEDKVMIQDTPGGTLIFYMDCDASGIPRFYRVRTTTFASPTGSAINNCETTDCANIDLAQIDECSGWASGDCESEKVRQVGEMVPFPINFNIHRSEGAQDAWKAAWAITGSGTQAGKTGVVSYIAGDAVTDTVGRIDGVASGQTDAGGDLCTGETPGGQSYVGIAQSSINVKIYPVTFTESLVGTFSSSFGSPAQPFGSGIAIDCRDEFAAASSTTTFGVYNVGTGANINASAWPVSCTCQLRGTAISGERTGGRIVAWTSTLTEFKVARALTGEVLMTGTLADGATIRGMELDEQGNNLFIASGSNVRRYAVSTIIGTSGSGGSVAPPPAPVADAGISDSGTNLATALGITTFGGNLFAGIIVMAFCAAGFFVTFRNILMGLLGLLVGFVLAWALGFFSAAVVFSMIALGAIAVFFLPKRGAGAD